MKSLEEDVAAICGIFVVLVAVVIGVTVYNLHQLDYRRAAIEHGCSIDSREVVICAAGDRK